ncbi:hypothetical protein Tsubulata_045074, partial [Turnera subulata]
GFDNIASLAQKKKKNPLVSFSILWRNAATMVPVEQLVAVPDQRNEELEWGLVPYSGEEGEASFGFFDYGESDRNLMSTICCVLLLCAISTLQEKAERRTIVAEDQRIEGLGEWLVPYSGEGGEASQGFLNHGGHDGDYILKFLLLLLSCLLFLQEKTERRNILEVEVEDQGIEGLEKGLVVTFPGVEGGGGWEGEDYGEEYDDYDEYGDYEYDDDAYGDYGGEYEDEEHGGGGGGGGGRRGYFKGDLRNGGAWISDFWYPLAGEWLKKEKDPIPVIKNLQQPGMFVAPNQYYLDKFLNSLSRRARHFLTPYFQMIQKSMGFEVPSGLPDDDRLPFLIIRPANEHPLFKRTREKDGIMDDVDKCIDNALYWIEVITGEEHELLGEVERVNMYRYPLGFYYLTFKALNLSTKQSETFQAVVHHSSAIREASQRFEEKYDLDGGGGEEEYYGEEDDYDEYGDYGQEYQDEHGAYGYQDEYGGIERGVIVGGGWRGIGRKDIEGDLRSGGAWIMPSWNPRAGNWLEKKKAPVIKNLKQPGMFVAPNQEYLDMFLNSLSRRLRHRLTPYFKMIQKTMGFEVPPRLSYDLPFLIIRRADEDPLFERNSEKYGIMDAVDDCIDDALFWIQLITENAEHHIYDSC